MSKNTMQGEAAALEKILIFVGISSS